MITINQGKPSPGFFVVLQPSPGGKIKIGDSVKCVDPKTGTATVGECVDFWKFGWLELPDSFCRLTYGVDALTLKTALENSKHEFRNKEYISFMLIKETK